MALKKSHSLFCRRFWDDSGFIPVKRENTRTISCCWVESVATGLREGVDAGATNACRSSSVLSLWEGRKSLRKSELVHLMKLNYQQQIVPTIYLMGTGATASGLTSNECWARRCLTAWAPGPRMLARVPLWGRCGRGGSGLSDT